MNFRDESDRIRTKLAIAKAAVIGLAAEAERNNQDNQVAFGALSSLHELEQEIELTLKTERPQAFIGVT